MKITGWILVILGVLSFFGSALKGNSAIGPAFIIAIGAFLLYRVSHKEQESKQEQTDARISPKNKNLISDSHIAPVVVDKGKQIQQTYQQSESLEDIQSQLTLQQREAAMCLISFFGGSNNDLMDDAPMVIFKQSALFFGLPDSPIAMYEIMSEYTNADTLIDIVLSIKPVKVKEFLLLTCHDLIKSTGKSEAYDLLFNIANDMGYDRTRLINLIRSYK